MTEVSEELKNLELAENIFRDVKYYVTGDVDDNVLEFLKAGGAERMNYFSDYVTHLICGTEPEETDLSDAAEIYEIPSVTVKWVIYSSQLKRLLNTDTYLYNTNKLFSNLTFCFSSIGNDRAALWAIITYNGGVVQLNLDRNCNYLVTTSTTSEKYLKAESFGNDITIVTPDWIIESVRNKIFAHAQLFHPRLIAWPKVIKHESTTAITGFEPDEVTVSEGNLENILPDSTQALLEELKQRMPWNQPQTSPSTEVAPPNVVAPSYTNSKLPQQIQEITQQKAVQQRLFSQQQQQLNIQKQPQLSSNTFTPNQQVSLQQQQPPPQQQPPQQQQPSQQQQPQQQQLNFLPPTSQVPRSIVHHPPQPSIQNQQQQQQSPLQFSVNQQVPFSQSSLTPSQRLRILEHMQQNRQRLTQQQFNQLQQQQRAQQINQQQQQQISQLQQENQMGQVNQQQQQQQQQSTNQINQLRQSVQNPQQVPQTSQQLILTSQNQLTQSSVQQLTQSAAQQLTQNQLSQETQQLLQSIQPNQQLIQSQQVRQINQAASQQVTSLAQLQMVQNQQQQHSNLGQIAKSPSTLQQQQHLTPQQLLQRQIQNQHLLKSQHILQNQQQQLQNQLNQQQQQNQINQQQQQQGQPVQQNQISQQLLQNQQSQITSQTQLQQQLSQQSQLEQQLTQTHISQQQQQQQQIVQNQLNQRQLNQLNQHLLQNQLVQQQQQLGQSQVVQQQQQQITQNQLNQQQAQQQLRQTQINVQQQQLSQLSQQQINQSRLVIQQQQQQQQHQQQQQQQNKILQNQFDPQQIISQQTVVVSQNQQNVLQQQFGSPNSQQFSQQTFVQSPSFSQAQQQQQQQLQQQQQQLLQAQQAPPQVICQQQPPQQQQQQQLLVQQQQQIKPQQIITQQQIVNQKLNIQQIAGQQHILLQQQQNQQGQNNQESPQRSASTHLWQQQQTAPPPPPPTPQPQQPQQISIQRHPSVQGQGPRVQWAPNQQPGVVLPQRQYIHLDEQTHQQLQQMSPEDRALFVQKLHKHRQVLQSRMQQQQQQRAGHILIRGGVPIGLNSQQQMQWLQQAKQQGVVLQQNIQQPLPQATIVQQANPNIQHAPGLSPIQQQTQTFTDQNQQLQLQRQQQQQLRLQQLQLHQQQQREQAQKTALQQQQQQQQQQQPPPPPLQPQQPPPPPTVVRALSNQAQVVDGNGVVAVPPPVVVDPNVVQSQNPLVVNSKTKTALANMLNTRLQSGGSALNETIAEPSAAGTLKLMTAQHNAALSTGTRPHDLLFLQQRRIINRPNGEVIRPPPAASAPPPQPDPPKLQYSPRNSVPLQHRPGTYYGHNPNLKLPPDLFLLGCVFVVVELERFLDESMPGWQKKIEKHGGEIEKQYCNRVTHVICETQRHGVVMQALRDYKRCVTLYWLSDVINRKQVLPPWIALHLPTMYWDTAPASKHLICLTGFEGAERDRIKHMIKYIGASLTTYFSKHNTLLITTRTDGQKYGHAKKWGTPVVNVQWLTDIMLGHFSALNQTEHVKYQHFTDPANFSFDPLLVPNLMHPWKMPINISQESYEKVKRSASPVIMPPISKPKKIKTEHITTDENDNEEDVPKGFSTHRVLFSMCTDVEELKKIVRQLGGTIAKTFRDCTHLVMPQLKRTHKLLCCICVGSYILPDSWLRDSAVAGKFLDELNYSLDTKEFNSEFRCDFNQTLCTKNRDKLFEGKYFYITPSVVPRKRELIELAQCCGGMVEKTRRTLAHIEATNVNSPYSYVILTHENDLHMVADLLKNKNEKVRIVCNSELILSAILKQTFEVEPYAVKFL